MEPTRVQGAAACDMIIRPYRAEDRAACKWVFYRAVREGAAAFYSEAERAVWAASPEPDLSVADKLLDQWAWVSEDDNGQITGFISLRRDGYLDMAFVLPEMMGKGAAAALYEAVLAQAGTAGFERLTVHASHLARRFFEKRGWKVDAVEDYPVADQKLRRFCMSLGLGRTRPVLTASGKRRPIWQ
ncbi:GNAT family N-acetyltransferase [Thioclava sp. FR2]|uniref:GNAT family N-acetyltransferase n=1 Tax=Thioclava sp. FR2 TaxID=3445780 RepID=UPI003EBF6154